MLVDAINRQPVELIHWAHPLRVASCQVVVHCYNVYTLMCQRIQEYWKSCNQCLTLTSSHLRNLTLVKYDTTKELHIVVYHLPLQVVATRQPVCGVDSLVALDCNEILAGSQVAVEVVGCNLHSLVLSESASCVLHNGKCLWKNLIENLLNLLVDALCC